MTLVVARIPDGLPVPDWNRSYRRLLAYLMTGGTRAGPANRTGLGDDPTFGPGPGRAAGQRAPTAS